jgi:hypothetical protein
MQKFHMDCFRRGEIISNKMRRKNKDSHEFHGLKKYIKIRGIRGGFLMFLIFFEIKPRVQKH